MYILKLKHHFDAAHHLLNYKGACAKMHGHRWEVEVEIRTYVLKNDMVIDFKTVKAVIDKLDHGLINKTVKFNPTAENLSKYLFTQISKLVGKDGSVRIELWESPGASITYLEEVYD